jgi:hypothetical protein
MPPMHASVGPEVSATAGYIFDSSGVGGQDPGIGTTDLVGLEFGPLARFGLLPNLDVGLRLSPGLLGLADVKYRFLSGPVSAAAGLGFSFYPRTGQILSTTHVGGAAFYPVIVAGSERLFGGLRAVVLHGVEDDPGKWWFQPGAYLGASLGQRVELQPELSVGIVDQPAIRHIGYRRLIAVGAGLALSFQL